MQTQKEQEGEGEGEEEEHVPFVIISIFPAVFLLGRFCIPILTITPWTLTYTSYYRRSRAAASRRWILRMRKSSGILAIWHRRILGNGTFHNTHRYVDIASVISLTHTFTQKEKSISCCIRKKNIQWKPWSLPSGCAQMLRRFLVFQIFEIQLEKFLSLLLELQNVAKKIIIGEGDEQICKRKKIMSVK